jgi:hypothetical protein
MNVKSGKLKSFAVRTAPRSWYKASSTVSCYLIERTRVDPILESDIPCACGTGSTINRNSRDDESDNSGNLNGREPEFKFAVPSNTHKVDDQYEDVLDGDPDCDVNGCVPILNHNRSRSEFDWECDTPAVPVVNAKCEADSRIND